MIYLGLLAGSDYGLNLGGMVISDRIIRDVLIGFLKVLVVYMCSGSK